MSLLQEALNRVRSFLKKEQRDAELNDELATHLALAVEDNIQLGMTPEEARRRALVGLGGVAQAQEQHRAARGLPWLDVLRQDLHFTLRTLGRDPGFTTIAVIILGLGIGANVAVYSVVNTILLRPLPFYQPQQLVRILSKNVSGGESGMTYSTDAMQTFQQQNRSFASVSGYYAFSGPDNLKLGGSGQPMPVTGLMVAQNFFPTLGVQPVLGRLSTPEEAVHGARPVVLLSYPFWKRQYKGDPAIIGRAIDLNKIPVTVVGVMPESFDFGSVFSPGTKVDLFWPVVLNDIEDQGNTMALIGRLNPGVSLAQAQGEVDLLFPHLLSNVKHPEYGAYYTGKLLDLKDYVSGKLRRSLIVLWCAVVVILLIVCVNLSNLLLARGAARSKEFAMRTALGASRSRLVRQLLTESLLLSGMGALLGLGIASAVIFWLAQQGSIALPLLSSVRIDGAVLGWTVLVAIAAAAFFGLAPSIRMAGSNLQEALKDSGHGTSAGRKHETLRSALIITEIGMACVLLVGAGLLLRSFLRILDVDLGFQPSRAASISLDYNDGGHAEKRGVLWQEVLRQVQLIPGVESAGITDSLPMSRNRSWDISAKGREHQAGLEGTFVYVVSPGYLSAMGMRMVQGRDLRWDDNDKKQPVVVINETVARKLWPGQSPIGRIAEIAGFDTRVIGVVADVHESSVEDNAGWQMYLSGVAPQFGPEGAQLVVRTKLDPETLAEPVMRTLREINPGQPAVEFRPIQRLVDHVVSPRRFFVLLVGIFAVLGLILASLGIYGVISYSVTQRTQEIGIRMALGASQRRVQLAVIFNTLRLAIVGIALGTVASLSVGKLVASLLYGTPATDGITFLSMIVLLASVALVAGYVPARRASRIDPMVALRNN